MLSRLAESSFWMGRYLERSEGISRLLLEFYHLVIQDQTTEAQKGCAILINGLGLTGSAQSGSELVKIIAGQSDDPGTILGAIYGARANARSIRDTLHSDFYESINRLQVVADNFDFNAPAQTLKMLLDRLAVANGVYEWLAPDDQSTLFFTLGRCLERIDLVSRLLQLNIEGLWREQGGATILQAVGGLSTFQKSQTTMTVRHIREFLIRDETFPRSLYKSSRQAGKVIRELASANQTMPDQIFRRLGLFESQMQFLTKDPSEQLAIILAANSVVEATHEAVRDHFFRPVGSIVWSN